MSRRQLARNRENFPKMKLRGPRYAVRMTVSERWHEAGRVGLAAFNRSVREFTPAMKSLGETAEEIRPVLDEFAEAISVPSIPDYPRSINPNQSRRTS